MTAHSYYKCSLAFNGNPNYVALKGFLDEEFQLDHNETVHLLGTNSTLLLELTVTGIVPHTRKRWHAPLGIPCMLFAVLITIVIPTSPYTITHTVTNT